MFKVDVNEANVKDLGELVQEAVKQLLTGATRIELQSTPFKLKAYWVGHVMRLDVVT